MTTRLHHPTRTSALAGAALLAALLAGLLAPATARAQPDPRPTGVPAPAPSKVSADDWLRIGLERYQRANYTGAIDAFERAYAIDARPAFLFAIAQAHRLRGDCAAAVDHYRRFLATDPRDDQAEAAQDLQATCEAALAAAPPAPPPPPPAPAPAPAPPAPSAATRSPWRDPLTLGAGAGAVTLLAGGTVLAVLAYSAADAAAVAPEYDLHRTLRQRAERRQTLAALTVGAGLTLATVAAWRAWRHTRRDSAPPATGRVDVTPTAGPDHVGLSVTGSF